MTFRSRFKNRSNLNLEALPPKLFGYGLVIFLIALADATMAYSTPVFIESIIHNPFYMGLILSTSSLVGFLADVYIGQKFGHQRSYFFLFWTIFIGLTFPLSLILFPPLVPVFILSMAVWGIYFELMEFSNFHFVHEASDSQNYNKIWGYLSIFKAFAYLLGPLIATTLITVNSTHPFYASLAFFFASLLGLMFFNRHDRKKPIRKLEKRQTSLMSGLLIWLVLAKRVWPVWLFTLAVFIVDASFWTVGTLLSEELRHLHPAGAWILPAYIAPGLFAGLITKKVAEPFGKKRAAFLSGIFGGVFLFMFGITGSIGLMLILISLGSFFLALAIPEIMAVSEDYVNRLGKYSNDMVGLERSAVSSGYIIGPIFAGGVASILGNHLTFSVIGVVIILVSLLALILTPEKIFLPQKELSQQK